ncbi:hypothetical protein L0M81_13240, partial [Alistipes putredinis]|nr:hypothetical protein [Alistipes putredinis]
LKANFNIGFIALLPIIFLLILLLLQKPPIVSILASAILGGVIAGILQKTGFLEVLLQPMIEKIGNSRTKLVGATFITSYFANAFS